MNYLIQSFDFLIQGFDFMVEIKSKPKRNINLSVLPVKYIIIFIENKTPNDLTLKEGFRISFGMS